MKIYRNIADFKPEKKVFLTVGTFDGIHFGHQKIIDSLKSLANEEDGESVMLTFSPHPRLVLFPENNNLKLINTLDEKINRLESSGIDHLIIYPFTKDFSRISALEYVRDFLVKEIKVSTLIIGYDHQFGRNREGNFEYLKELSELYGFDVKEISAQDINDINVSSTKIRKAIELGDIPLANEYLGYTFPLIGKVIEGKKLGNTIGFPTANLLIEDKTKIIPKPGAYVVYVEVDGNRYKAMLNIGKNPTIDESEQEKIEVNLFDFDGNLYQKTIKVEFIERLRDEVKFDSLDALKNQLRLDKANSLKILT
ncbi:bifunctional riboflavin kinase/FAD synthetase [Flavobacteriales bacterium]|nr:bifunctional riboflavin kinase/FAD synthetase [Flavobacteriales bacterium]MDC0015446.1 bifunctional riboflavin kinase/FAD synthetase [Flavobacteriales bacterium]MDC1352822.1 bifunctional riboflavin kinase/FAD synthetase [Flavobacteriales bacterium]